MTATPGRDRNQPNDYDKRQPFSAARASPERRSAIAIAYEHHLVSYGSHLPLITFQAAPWFRSHDFAAAYCTTQDESPFRDPPGFGVGRTGLNRDRPVQSQKPSVARKLA